MKSFVPRWLSIIAISLLLTACQSTPEQTAAEAINTALHQLEVSIEEGHLNEAEAQLRDLQHRAAGDIRLENYQRQLAEAYLLKGQKALQAGDLDGAAKSLSHARSLMPQAPALTTGLDGAVERARDAEAAETPVKAAGGSNP
ncbi:hypothetical protein ACX0MV_00525 [Pseudomonas borbori]